MSQRRTKSWPDRDSNPGPLAIRETTELLSQWVKCQRTTIGATTQGENVKGRPCGSVAQLADCSHGKREALGSSPGRATIFSSPVAFGGSVWVRG